KSDWVQLREEYQTKQALKEFLGLRERFQQDVAPALAHAEQAYQKAFDEVLNSNRTRREDDKKQQAIEALEKARTDLQRAAASFATGPPAKDPRNQKAQRFVSELIEAQANLCGMAQDDIKQDVNLLAGSEADTALKRKKEESEQLKDWCRGYGLYSER